MFKELKNEAIITYKIKTESPLYLKSSEENALNPSATDGTFMTTYKNGVLEPFIPGTSLKGVFRSRAERILRTNGACDIVGKDECVKENDAKREKLSGEERYKRSCPVCRLFGSKVLRSRVSFGDAYVIGKYNVGQRTCVGIDRLTGAAKRGALYDMQYIEDATFEGKINLQNFEPYQIKLLMELFQEMNEGFITLGGLTSKGFGFVSAFDFKLKLKYYNIKEEMPGYEKKLYYQVKDIEGIDNIIELVKDVDMEKVKKDGAINEQAI